MKKDHLLNPKSVLWKVLSLMLGVMLIQFILLYGFFFFGGLLDQLKSNEFDILEEKVNNRSNEMQRNMVQRWSNISETVLAVSNKVSAALSNADRGEAAIGEDLQLSTQILTDVSDDLIYCLRRNSVTGVFLILNGTMNAERPTDGEGQSRPGVYIRDLNPDSNPDDNSDLLLERAPSELSKSLGISLDMYWQPQFTLGNSAGIDDSFYNPLQAALENPEADSMDLGYWAPYFQLRNDNIDIITYSVPLISEDGVAYGVLGVELTSSYLAKKMPYAELDEEKQGSYLLGVQYKGEDTFQSLVASGPYYHRIFGTETAALLDEFNGSDGIYPVNHNGRIDDTVYACVSYLNLYNANTPFVNNRWAVIGVIEGNELLRFYNQFTSSLAWTFGVALLIGVIGICLSASRIAHPIRILARKVRSSDPDAPVHFGTTGIFEIDELSHSVEDLSRNVAESASRLTEIVRLAGYPIGAFEYRSSGKVFCTDDFYVLLNLEQPTAGMMTWEEFQAMLSSLSRFIEERDENDAYSIYKLPDPLGGYRWVRMKSIYREAGPLGVVTDITSEYLERKKIEYERDYDSLTNLLNRRAFHEKMTQIFAEPWELRVGVMIMIDLDNLKYINDTYGHDCGDEYICSAADVLRHFASPKATVARMSGDEFYVFIAGTTYEEVRAQISALEQNFHNASMILPDSQELKVRLSAGVAWYPDDADNFEQLVQYADFAMYRVKHTYKGQFGEFTLDSYNRESYLLQNKEELNQLIDGKLVDFNFQPIISTKDGSVFAYEALMRPRTQHLASPLDVLALARSQSKLYEIERLSMFGALEKFSALEAENSGKSIGCRLFVNSIPNQLLPFDDIDEFETEYRPFLNRLVIELTEEERIDSDMNNGKQRLLHSWGAGVALDDFGSGYNSESVLLTVSPDFLKIDRMLIQRVDLDSSRLQILQNLVAYAHQYGIKVIAEGIETRGEMETLIRNNVDYLQGFYLGRPADRLNEAYESVTEEIKAIRGRFEM